MDSSLMALCCLALVLLLVALRVSYSLYWVPIRLQKHLKQQGVRGTSYKLLYGDMKEYIKLITQAWDKPMNQTHEIAPRVVPFAQNAIQRYGKTALIWAGKTPRLIVLEPNLMKDILSDNSGCYQKPPINDLILSLTRGLASLEGEKWIKHRRIINPAFQMEKLKVMVPEISNSCIELIQHWKGLIGEQGSCELDIWSEFQTLTGDIIARTAFGSNFEEGKRIFQLLKEQATLVVEAMLSLYIPGFKYVPTKKNRKRNNLSKEINSMLTEMIHNKERRINNIDPGCDDLLSMLLGSRNQKGLTIDEIIEECKQFYFAGQETTASLLTWTIIVLAMHPDWQEKAREEVEQICGKVPVDYESLSRLKIVTMVLYEVLRLYPPVVEIYRHTYKDTKVGDISLPPGVVLTLPILLIHHERELWGDDVEEFKPERFANGVSKASKNQQNAFFPFGWGPRICIGQNFAMIEAKVALATVLQHFSFQLSPSYAHAPYTVMTLQPQHGAQVILHQL